jgi:dolichol-phosphate mannosyltransferase
MNELDIIIPIYKEGNNIKLLIENFHKKLKISYKIIICYDFDNESGLKFLPENDKKLILVKNKGKGPNEAIKSGLEKSKNKFVVVYMSDDFENIELLNKMYDLVNSGWDLIIPSRYVANGQFINAKFYKKMITNFGSFLMYFICGIPYRDCTNAFKMFNKEILNKIKLKSKIGFTFALELTIKAHLNNLKIKEIPSTWKELPYRKSNFKVFRWLPFYIYWFLYALTYRLKK